MLQIAVHVKDATVDRVPNKIINRAVLTYDEAPGVICLLMSGSEERPCWSDGEGAAEHKPDGCVVVRVPTVDWPNNPPPGLIPYSTHPGGPAVKRLGAREWDVTEPYRWQQDPRNVPLTPAGMEPLHGGYGFLLSGAPSLDQLEGEDDTNCVSKITNIRLHVTYTVPPGSGELPVVR